MPCWNPHVKHVTLQDTPIATSLGQKSYNEVVEQLVMILGDATPKRLLSSQPSRRNSGYSTPRRTSSSLAALAASDLASPVELHAAPPRPPAASVDAASSTLSATSTADAAAVPEAAAGPLSAGSSADFQVTPTGALTSSVANQHVVSEAEQAGGPTGCLVSTQQVAQVTDSSPAPSTDAMSSHEPHDVQLLDRRSPLISPAADLAARSYPLPAGPLEDGVPLSSPASSGMFAGHIASAPTPHPSLASDFSQALNLPASPTTSVSGSEQHASPAAEVVSTDSSKSGLALPSGAAIAGDSPCKCAAVMNLFLSSCRPHQVLHLARESHQSSPNLHVIALDVESQWLTSPFGAAAGLLAQPHRFGNSGDSTLQTVQARLRRQALPSRLKTQR